MYRILKTRIDQGHRTVKYPKEAPSLPELFRGLPAIDPSACTVECIDCLGVCPVQAIQKNGRRGVSIDLGRCIFCGACEKACPRSCITFTREFRMAARTREGLVVTGERALVKDNRSPVTLDPLHEDLLRLFRRSFKVREVSAGGCNACEADVNVLNTIVFDLSRFGIQFVASPRHADALLVTGPVTRNMELALRKTYEATPHPKVVIAVGACAISGGMFAGHEEVCRGADTVLPVDLYVPGCPPNPYTTLDGLLCLLGRQTEKCPLHRDPPES